MSVEIKGVDQFASSQGWRDLRAAAKGDKTLSEFFDSTHTQDVPAVQKSLRKLAHTASKDVAATASGLADMLEGMSSASITDGAGTYEHMRGESDEDGTSLRESLKHPKHASALAPIKEQGADVFRRFFRAQRRKTVRKLQTHLHVLASHNPNLREADQAAKDKVSEVLPAGSSIPSPVSSGMVIDWSKALHAALEAGYDGLATENDFSGEPAADAISEYLREHSLEKLTGDIAPTTVDYLRDALADAYESGAGYEELRQAVLDRFDEMSDKRADLIAQTELNNAYNVGRRKLADDMSFNEKSWSADGPNPCPECIGNVLDGWIPIDDPFSSGDMLATAHPGCFCSNDFRFSAAAKSPS